MAVTSNAPVARAAMASGESDLRFEEWAADIVIEGNTFNVATRAMYRQGDEECERKACYD